MMDTGTRRRRFVLRRVHVATRRFRESKRVIHGFATLVSSLFTVFTLESRERFVVRRPPARPGASAGKGQELFKLGPKELGHEPETCWALSPEYKRTVARLL